MFLQYSDTWHYVEITDSSKDMGNKTKCTGEDEHTRDQILPVYYTSIFSTGLELIFICVCVCVCFSLNSNYIYAVYELFLKSEQ